MPQKTDSFKKAGFKKCWHMLGWMHTSATLHNMSLSLPFKGMCYFVLLCLVYENSKNKHCGL